MKLRTKVARSYLKIRILAQGQGGSEIQPVGILKYVEDLKRGANAEIGLKNFFEMPSNVLRHKYRFKSGTVKTSEETIRVAHPVNAPALH